MHTNTLTREEALSLLRQYNREPFHLRHAFTVEGVMRYFARTLGYADEEEYWGQVGLLHDIDFEQYPEQHCQKAPELLAGGGVGEDMIHAVCSHGYGICCDAEPEHEMEKVLFAVDELTGLVAATARMRPGGLSDLEPSSVKKKFKDKKFAAKINRPLIQKGCDMLGMELTDVMALCIEGMREHMDELGLGPKA